MERAEDEVPAYRIVYHTNDQATTRTGRDIFVICQLSPRYLETIPAWTWIVIDPLFLIPSHILDFNLVIVGTHCCRNRMRGMVLQP